MQDKWEHRSKRMRCKTCMWFVGKAPDKGFVVRGLANMKLDAGEIVEVNKDADMPAPQPAIGRCRKHAPTMSGYPVVFEDDWCGDHKLDENA